MFLYQDDADQVNRLLGPYLASADFLCDLEWVTKDLILTLILEDAEPYMKGFFLDYR